MAGKRQYTIIHATAMQQAAARAKKGASRRMHLKAVPKHQHCGETITPCLLHC
ncbi:hypothetical protein UUU_00340 [Klebsiella pneumoniae subsp. pneumoniae DSM 30104 = JCM 1662 = NBRC 14940]|nr:hypothetical protein UUU_00340 [Klebsiella pneumoniae subsp. pneumoniae DSM 30104 = JCM 1662 = NBRC 14940]